MENRKKIYVYKFDKIFTSHKKIKYNKLIFF